MKKNSHRLFWILPLSFLLCITFSCQQQPPAEEGMTEEEAKLLLENSLKIFNEGNLDLIDDLHTPDYVRHDTGLPQDITGLAAFKEYVTSLRTGYPDFTVTPHEQFIKGDMQILRWTVTGTNTGPMTSAAGELPPTGKSMSVPGVNITRIVDGKIAEEWVFYNQLYVYTQLGYTLTPPAAEEPPEKK